MSETTSERVVSHPMLIAGTWTAADPAAATFRAADPSTGATLEDAYPVATWDDLDALLDAGAVAARGLAGVDPARIAAFLDAYAYAIAAHADELVALAATETGLPVSPRLAEVELPRTTDQLRQAATAARSGSWRLPVIDTAAGIRSQLEPLGRPVLVIGPNNFPFAFNGVAGGDFAAAVASGHAVIAKAHPAHPGTSRRLAELAALAVTAAGLPPATVQLYYDCSHEDGYRMVADPRLGALAFTGSERAGRALKAAADAVGTPAYFEMSGVNPVSILPGALAERGDAVAVELHGSCLLGTGQFCTNPGLVLTVAGEATDRFLGALAGRFGAAPAGVMLTATLPAQLEEGVEALVGAGAEVLARGGDGEEAGFRGRPTLLRVDGASFLADPATFQRELFGPASVVVVAADADQLVELAGTLEPSLTASFHTATDGGDDELNDRLMAVIAPRVGRILNDRMPTGVAVSPAMVHGGPFPAGGHPGFTSVGIPASLRRFGALRCYDNVRPARLPVTLRDRNPGGMWRCVDGDWTTGDIG